MVVALATVYPSKGSPKCQAFWGSFRLRERSVTVIQHPLFRDRSILSCYAGISPNLNVSGAPSAHILLTLGAPDIAFMELVLSTLEQPFRDLVLLYNVHICAPAR